MPNEIKIEDKKPNEVKILVAKAKSFTERVAFISFIVNEDLSDVQLSKLASGSSDPRILASHMGIEDKITLTIPPTNISLIKDGKIWFCQASVELLEGDRNELDSSDQEIWYKELIQLPTASIPSGIEVVVHDEWNKPITGKEISSGSIIKLYVGAKGGNFEHTPTIIVNGKTYSMNHASSPPAEIKFDQHEFQIDLADAQFNARHHLKIEIKARINGVDQDRTEMFTVTPATGVITGRLISTSNLHEGQHRSSFYQDGAYTKGLNDERIYVATYTPNSEFLGIFTPKSISHSADGKDGYFTVTNVPLRKNLFAYVKVGDKFFSHAHGLSGFDCLPRSRGGSSPNHAALFELTKGHEREEQVIISLPSASVATWEVDIEINPHVDEFSMGEKILLKPKITGTIPDTTKVTWFYKSEGLSPKKKEQYVLDLSTITLNPGTLRVTLKVEAAGESKTASKVFTVKGTAKDWSIAIVAIPEKDDWKQGEIIKLVPKLTGVTTPPTKIVWYYKSRDAGTIKSETNELTLNTKDLNPGELYVRLIVEVNSDTKKIDRTFSINPSTDWDVDVVSSSGRWEFSFGENASVYAHVSGNAPPNLMFKWSYKPEGMPGGTFDKVSFALNDIRNALRSKGLMLQGKVEFILVVSNGSSPPIRNSGNFVVNPSTDWDVDVVSSSGRWEFGFDENATIYAHTKGNVPPNVQYKWSYKPERMPGGTFDKVSFTLDEIRRSLGSKYTLQGKVPFILIVSDRTSPPIKKSGLITVLPPNRLQINIIANPSDREVPIDSVIYCEAKIPDHPHNFSYQWHAEFNEWDGRNKTRRIIPLGKGEKISFELGKLHPISREEFFINVLVPELNAKGRYSLIPVIPKNESIPITEPISTSTPYSRAIEELKKSAELLRRMEERDVLDVELDPEERRAISLDSARTIPDMTRDKDLLEHLGSGELESVFQAIESTSKHIQLMDMTKPETFVQTFDANAVRNVTSSLQQIEPMIDAIIRDLDPNLREIKKLLMKLLNILRDLNHALEKGRQDLVMDALNNIGKVGFLILEELYRQRDFFYSTEKGKILYERIMELLRTIVLRGKYLMGLFVTTLQLEYNKKLEKKESQKIYLDAVGQEVLQLEQSLLPHLKQNIQDIESDDARRTDSVLHELQYYRQMIQRVHARVNENIPLTSQDAEWLTLGLENIHKIIIDTDKRLEREIQVHPNISMVSGEVNSLISELEVCVKALKHKNKRKGTGDSRIKKLHDDIKYKIEDLQAFINNKIAEKNVHLNNLLFAPISIDLGKRIAADSRQEGWKYMLANCDPQIRAKPEELLKYICRNEKIYNQVMGLDKLYWERFKKGFISDKEKELLVQMKKLVN